MKDEFNRKKEFEYNRKIKEFKRFDAIEYYRKLDRYDKWLAQWTKSPTYNKSFGIWQYSSKGSLPGINGNVDLNISYKDYPSIIGKKKNDNTSSNNRQDEKIENNIYAKNKVNIIKNLLKNFISTPKNFYSLKVLTKKIKIYFLETFLVNKFFEI